MRPHRDYVPANLIWTERDIDYLKARYPTDGAAKIAAVIGKTHIQVRNKANRLHLSTFIEGRTRRMREKPSSLERRVASMLTDLDVAFEPSCIIKPKFIADFRIGALIIEADGDWWHGHPRFEPLNIRQQAQQQRDAARNAYLTACGYTVVRIWESDLSQELLVNILRQHQAATSTSLE